MSKRLIIASRVAAGTSAATRARRLKPDMEIAGYEWTEGICPNCGYVKAKVDPEGFIWCPACGYSKKGCYT